MFIEHHGRRLDQRLFEHHFESATEEGVLAEVSRYQNLDGGSGHALEPDLRTPVSSVVATSQGLYILREVGATVDEPMVRSAIGYLLTTYDPSKGAWPIIPKEADDAPHAWHWSHERAAELFGGFLVNPRVAVLGHPSISTTRSSPGGSWRTSQGPSCHTWRRCRTR